MSSGRPSGFATSSFGGDGEMSPEDLFNMFFGGQGANFAGGGVFGGGGPGKLRHFYP